MTPAVVQAALAGALGGWGIAELGFSAAGGRRRRSRRGTARLASALARLGRRIGAPAAPADLALRIERAGTPAGARPRAKRDW